MTLQDLIEVDCRTRDVKLQLVKLIESTIQLTSVKSQLPLASLLPHLVTLDDTQEFLSTFDYTPLDFAIIRIRLLSNYYDVFQKFIFDVNHALFHYDKIQQAYNLPNISQQAKNIVIQGITNLPFTQFLHQPFDLQLALQLTPKESIRTLQISEMALFLNLVQDFDNSQNEKLETFCKNLQIVLDNKVEMSKISPQFSRKIVDFAKEIALPGQIEGAKRRIEIVNELGE